MSGDKSLTAVSNRVEKKDSNEPPEFEEGATAPRTVVENTPPGHPIGAPVTATDPDDRPSALSYALSGQDAAFFEIDASGQIMVGEDTVLDYETKREYRVTVTVTDPANATDSIIVTIEVLDVNEPPAFAVETATLPIPENTPAGQAIDDPLTATDEDTNDTLTYTLSGRDATFFAVDANGQLTVGGGTVLDHETQQTYSLTVTATDNAEPPATASIPVSITVTDAPGTVSLSPTPPQVGRELTASVDDPDPPVSVSTWRWERSEDKTTWSLIEGASTATYTPSSDDSRHYLRVTVAYTDTDGRGTAKQAEKITAQPVSARRRPPPPPGPGPGPGGGDDPVCADDRHGNTAAQATDIALATETAGAICPAADVDYVTVTVPERGLVFVDTTGSVPTRGTIWQNDEVLASGSTGGRGARLGARVQAGAVVVAVQGQGGATGTYAVEITFVQGYLENPGAESFQSGMGVLSGWVCDAAVVEMEINGTQRSSRLRHRPGRYRWGLWRPGQWLWPVVQLEPAGRRRADGGGRGRRRRVRPSHLYRDDLGRGVCHRRRGRDGPRRFPHARGRGPAGVAAGQPELRAGAPGRGAAAGESARLPGRSRGRVGEPGPGLLPEWHRPAVGLGV